jgi:hypothetical protein
MLPVSLGGAGTLSSECAIDAFLGLTYGTLAYSPYHPVEAGLAIKKPTQKTHPKKPT